MNKKLKVMIRYRNKKTNKPFLACHKIDTFEQFKTAFEHEYNSLKSSLKEFMMRFDFDNLEVVEK